MTCKEMHPLPNLLSFLKNRQPAEMDKSYTGLHSDWYLKEHIKYSFAHPHVMSRLERLMGTNIVVLTDRKYMLELQRRIQEDHVNAIKERIKEREKDELDREKNLILEGKIPLTAAPQELVEHPVFRITQMANDFIKELNENSKKKAPKVSRPETSDDPCSVLAEQYQLTNERQVSVAPPTAEQFLPSRSRDDESSESEDTEASKEEEESNEEEEEELTEASDRRNEDEKRKSEDSDIQNGYMLPDDHYDRLHYETDHVKAMWTLETVEDLYDMAEQVVKDVVAHRPHDSEPEDSQPSSSAKPTGVLDPEPQRAISQDSQVHKSDSQNAEMNMSKAPKKTTSKAKEEKSGKHRFSWRKR